MHRAAILLLPLAACSQLAISPEDGADICEERARTVQAPTGDQIVGVNTRSGLNAIEIYEICVFDLTAAAPIRPPVLN